MTKQRINGQSFDMDLGETAVHVQKFTLDITDNTTAAKRNGRPDGWLQGDVAASGEMTIDRDGMRELTSAAKSAGSWQQLPTFDINSFAKAGDDEFKVEAFGCKIKLNKLLDVDKNSTDETLFSVPFEVTSPDFVSIDGVPYLTPLEN